MILAYKSSNDDHARQADVIKNKNKLEAYLFSWYLLNNVNEMRTMFTYYLSKIECLCKGNIIIILNRFVGTGFFTSRLKFEE